MSNTFEEFMTVLNSPGTDSAKRERLRSLMAQLIELEPNPFWSTRMERALKLIFEMYDVQERSNNSQDYDACNFEVRMAIRPLDVHITSMNDRST